LSPTRTPTPDPFYTPPPTPTPAPAQGECGSVLVSPAYPNPASSDQAFRFDYQAPCPVAVTWELFSHSFRRIRSETAVIEGLGTLTWDLKDRWGAEVANGTYHIRFRVGGSEIARQKLMVLR